jgi:hypothetical protein
MPSTPPPPPPLTTFTQEPNGEEGCLVMKYSCNRRDHKPYHFEGTDDTADALNGTQTRPHAARGRVRTRLAVWSTALRGCVCACADPPAHRVWRMGDGDGRGGRECFGVVCPHAHAALLLGRDDAGAFMSSGGKEDPLYCSKPTQHTRTRSRCGGALIRI